MRAATHRGWFLHSGEDLIANLVAFSRNRYATMHYDIMRAYAHISFQHFEPACKHPGRAATPSGMKKRDRPLSRRNQVDRDTVGNSYQHQLTRSGGTMPVSTLDDGPSGRKLVVPEHRVAVHLVAKHR